MMAAFAYTTDDTQTGATMNGAIGGLTFQVAEGLESCTTPIEIEVVRATDASGDVVLETSKRDATVTINGVTPTLETVTLSANTVTVDGSTEVAEISATAASAKGTNITGNVTWSVVSPENGKGVTIAADGKITVDAKAAAGDYTITATPDGTSVQGTAKTATLTVTRAAAEVQSIAIYQDETAVGENATIIVPASGDPNTYTYTVKSTDQYGDSNDVAAADVTWEFTPKATPADDKVSFNAETGVVSVATGATPNAEYDLKATASGKEAVVTLTAKDIEIDWPAVTDNKITSVYGKTWAEIVTPLDDGSAKVGETPVEGTFTLKENLDDKPGVTVTQYTVVFTSTDTDETYVVEQPFNVEITPKPLTECTVDDITAVTYTGSAITPEPVVKDGETALEKDTDYTVAYTDNTNAGTATVAITGIGNYSDGVTKTFVINSKALADSMVSEIAALEFTGSALEPAVTVTDGETALTAGTDYDVAYANNTAIGTATVTITGKGNYTGTVTVNFQISGKVLNDTNTVIADIADQTYTGSALEPAVTVTVGGTTTLTAGTDYDVAYENNVNAGTATAKITGKGNYGGTLEKTFTINPKTLTDGMATISGTYIYTGDAVEPAVSVKDGERNLTTSDYTVTFANNINAGIATATVTGQGNYDGEVTVEFTIVKAALPCTVVILAAVGESEGKIAPGVELTADVSGLPDGVVVSYQWTKNGENIPDATEDTYTVAEDDADARIAVVVTAAEGTANYQGSVTSEAVTVGRKYIRADSVKVEMSAELKDGKVTLTASVTVEGMDPADLPAFFENFVMRWFRNSAQRNQVVIDETPISADGKATYTITPEDAGTTITSLMVPKDDSEYANQWAAGSEPGTTPSGGNATDGEFDANGFKVPATAPSMPQNVSVSVSGKTATITWEAPAMDGGADLTGYEVAVYKQGTTPEGSTNVAASPYQTPELTSGTYTVSVAAVNSAGTSEPATATFEIKESSTPSGSGGGGGGGGSTTSSSSVTVSSTSHGSVSVNPRNPSKGSKVTLTVKPHTGYVLDSLNVQIISSGANVDLDKVSDTEYTFTMPSGRVRVNTTFVKADDKQDESTDTPTGFPFADAADSWARDAIAWAYEKGYVNGTSATTFNPNGNITRQQMWMILARLSGQNPYNMTEARQWAMDNGVSDGTNATNAMTRQQMVTFLYRYAQLKGYELTGETSLDSYPDSATVSGYAQTPLAWAVGNAIVNGTSDGTLNPGGTATRAQFATILQRFYNGVVGE